MLSIRARFLALAHGPVGMTAVAAILLVRRAGPLGIHPDTVRDLLGARDCVELGQCQSLGSSASAWHLSHGAGWTSFLSLCLASGLEARGVQVVLVLLQMTSVALFAVLTERLVTRRGAWLATMAWAAALAAMDDATTLWNPSPAPLPLVLFLGCLGWFLRDGAMAGAAAMGFWVGLLVSMHVGFAALLPVTLSALLLGARRPLPALLLSLAALLGPLAAFSRDLLFSSSLLPGRVLWIAGGAAVLVAAMAWLSRGRWRGLSAAGRQGAALLGMVLPVAAGLGAYRWSAGSVPARGLLVTAPAACVAVGWAAARFLPQRGARWPWAVVPAVLALLAAPDAAGERSPRWTFSDVSRAAPVVVKAASYDRLALRLQGPDCWAMLGAMAVEEPAPREPRGRLEDAYRLLATSRRDEAAPLAARGATLVELGRGRVAAFAVSPSRLRWAEAVVCVLTSRSRRCEPVSAAPSESLSADAFRFRQRSYPAVYDMDLPPAYTVEYEIPFRPWSGGDDWTLDVLPGNDGGSWEIVRSEPPELVPVATRALRIHAPDSVGTLVLAASFPGREPVAMDHRYPPCLLETRADEEAWRRAAKVEGGFP